jgi:HEXXH motif-containing protein
MHQHLLGNLPRPDQLDARVRSRLAKSLEYIVGKADRFIQADPKIMARAFERIRNCRQDPAVFARYFDLGFAVSSNRFEEADKLLSEIASLADQSPKFAILPFNRAAAGADFERFQRLLFAESPEVGPLVAPTDEEFHASAQNLRQAIEIIRLVDPAIHEEITELFVRLFVTKDAREDSSASFGGVTSFMIWGASFINIKAYKTLFDCVQYLVHEVTHALLFGLSCDEPLVTNAAAESYRSPLRSDPRPMDGIYHATLVCARLTAFNRAWLAQEEDGPRDQDSARRAMSENLDAFRDGLATIDQHGRLSDPGRELLERCRSGLTAVA